MTTATDINTEKKMKASDGDHYPNLPEVLKTLDNLSSGGAVDVSVSGLAEAVQKQCTKWKTENKYQSEQLVREYLEEGERTNKCKKSITQNSWSSKGSRASSSSQPEDSSLRTARVAQAPTSTQLSSKTKDTTTKSRTNSPKSSAATSTTSKSSKPIRPSVICKDCNAKNQTKKKSKTGLNAKEIVSLLLDQMKKDEQETGDVYCMCDTCMGVTSKTGGVCRRAQNAERRRSKRVHRKMKILRNHCQKMEIIKGGGKCQKDKSPRGTAPMELQPTDKQPGTVSTKIPPTEPGSEVPAEAELPKESGEGKSVEKTTEVKRKRRKHKKSRSGSKLKKSKKRKSKKNKSSEDDVAAANEGQSAEGDQQAQPASKEAVNQDQPQEQPTAPS